MGSGPEALTAQLGGLLANLCKQRLPLSRVLSVAVGKLGVVDPVSRQVRYALDLQALESPVFSTLPATRLGIGRQFHQGSASRAGELGYVRLTPQSSETTEDVLCRPVIAHRHVAAGGSGELPTLSTKQKMA